MTRCVRPVVGVAGALLVGAVVSVAIAWWAATHRPATMMVSKQHTLYRSRSGDEWYVQESGAWGTRCVMFMEKREMDERLGRPLVSAPTPAELPSWAEESGPYMCLEHLAFGWPLVCMKWTLDARGKPDYLTLDATRAGIGALTLPVRPCWLNLLASKALWGSVAWSVVSGVAVWPRARRRRVRWRYGHCPACDHDLEHRMDAGCSECGWRQNETGG